MQTGLSGKVSVQFAISKILDEKRGTITPEELPKILQMLVIMPANSGDKSIELGEKPLEAIPDIPTAAQIAIKEP